jgi:hypothetical protein
MPVRLPSGRLRLVTRPDLTGSVPTRKTIGTVVVAAFAGRRDHSCLVANQIGCESWQSINLIFRPAIFNRDVLAVDVACFAEALAERGHHRRVRSW